MKKINLPNVTLMGIDCVNVSRLSRAMNICEEHISFGEVKLLTSLETSDSRKVIIPHISSIEDFSIFCIKDLVDYVDTDFVLLVQHDGYIINPHSWSDEFLNYDYIGAPWIVADWAVKGFDFPVEKLGTEMVGNGGFCLRSKKFLEVSHKLYIENKIVRPHPEDVSLCVWNKEFLDAEGILFAPSEVANLFSIEDEHSKFNSQFGFHGFHHRDLKKYFLK